jgi:regulatory protein
MPFAKPSLKGRALKLLAAREHSRAELERKLAGHEEEPGQLRRALDDLQARGFIDDARVVEAIVHRRASRLGASRVRQELLARGVETGQVQTAVADLWATELDRAREVWRKKFGELPAGPADRAKQVRFLASRGFSGEVISRVLRAPDD